MANAAPHTSPKPDVESASPLLSRWLRWLLIVMLLAGISLRFVNIAPKHKAVSFAEARTVLHLSGQQFSDLRRVLSDGSLASHRPKAFVLNRDFKPFQTIQILGTVGEGLPSRSVTVWRIIAGLLSLLVLPAAGSLVRSLFPISTHSTKGMGSPLILPLTLAFLAVSPLHLAFAQEAQPTAIAFALLLAAQPLLFRGIQRKSWMAYFGYGFSLALLAWLLQLNPLSALGVVAMLVEWSIYLAIALGIQHVITAPERQSDTPTETPTDIQRGGERAGIRHIALGLMALGLTGAIALNIHQVMDFSGWLKGPANENLVIAQQLREHPAPLVSDPHSNHDLLSMLSLSHSLPDDAQWLILNLATDQSRAAQATTLPQFSYLYRPSTTLLDSIRASSSQAIQPLGNELWRWGAEPTATATP